MKALNFNLLEDFEISGRWLKLHENRTEDDLIDLILKDGIPGKLKYTSDSITLNLDGAFSFKGRISSIQDCEIVGYSNKGECFVLKDCYILSQQVNLPGYQTSTYRANRFIVAKEFLFAENDLFYLCNFAFSPIDDWLNNAEWRVGESEILIDKKESERNCLEARFKIGKQRVSLSEKIIFQRPIANRSRTNLTYKTQNYYSLRTHYKKRKNIDFFINNIFYFANLLELFTNRELNLKDITLFYKNQENQKFAKYFLAQRNLLSSNDNGYIRMNRWDIEKNYGDILSFWFSEKEYLESFIYNLLNEKYVYGYIEPRFLDTIKAIEGFYRVYVKESIQYEDSYLKERKKIIDFINENVFCELRNEFIKRINYEENLSLNKQIKNLIKTYPNNFTNARAIDTFAMRAAATRNYYAHAGEINNLVVTDVFKLKEMMDELYRVILYHLFVKMGIDKNVIEANMNNF